MDYRIYLDTILRPAAESYRLSMESESTQLHQAFSISTFTGQAIDYLIAIRQAHGDSITRTQFVKSFDEVFYIEGAKLLNGKFRLIDATNNALKHIKLDSKRYQELIQKYGPITFRCLSEQNKTIFCQLANYRFDYSRVVIRPILESLIDVEFYDLDQVREFAFGDWGPPDHSPFEEEDPIDQMIEYCNPICLDCGEGEAECSCETYRYGEEFGEFQPISNETFDFDDVMSKIYGSYLSD
ncbi:hypothetical protein [Algisphaera agarilytica]|nr:hypothetical protein [Algisphaera agarilytica]